jgi:hypothetical protein
MPFHVFSDLYRSKEFFNLFFMRFNHFAGLFFIFNIIIFFSLQAIFHKNSFMILAAGLLLSLPVGILRKIVNQVKFILRNGI